DADEDIVAVLLPGARLLQHFVGLADAGRGADKDLEPAGLPLFAPRGLEQGLRRRSLVRVAPLIRHQDSRCLLSEASYLTLARRRAIERQVERQYVHPRLAKKAKGASLAMLVDKLAHPIFRHVARFRNTGHLEKRGRRRNMRIEPAA